MGKLANAWTAFVRVWRGEELVPKSELTAVLAQSRRAEERTHVEPARADRFNEGAVYTLMLLQREGRLVDFLQEDLSGFSDEQIGVAVRQFIPIAPKCCAKPITWSRC